MPTATRVSKLGASSWFAIRKHQNPKRRQRKSLKLLSLVLRGPRKWKVLSVPRTPEGKSTHLLLQPGMEQVTGMAPPTKGGAGGWARLPSLSLPHYGPQWSRGHASRTSRTDYRGMEEAAGF